MTTSNSPERNRPAQRQAEIAEHVLQHGSMSANDLSELFGVSLMTIHRDLDELERQGIVHKFRGGVSAQPSSVFESNVTYRLRTAREEKVALARRARALIEPGMAVMLDDSTTTLELARLLEDAAPLTVITNFLETIKLVAGMRGIRLITLGGEYYPTHDSFLGVPCIEAIEALRVDMLFASVSAVSNNYAYHQEQEIVLVKRAMIRAAQKSVLSVDHSKLGRVALHRLVPLSDFDLVLTDSRAPEDSLLEMRENGIRYDVV
ncbi:DeoR/GlpR family DNA-binding transcription regulator [Streptosporangium sp. NBC_01639]|uniref:DeoR/GlpR family DNA-binding transcription regulator n=1 Tax=unclassified Streptosporangium TaxID=2632669 RepID=UPI002DDC1B6B|nr:DeoR/GlpR family DNA-binding transcription regulator [Streptosporangium sp. NBC_01756]WSC85652.1 DeoR/GlpR family DNA-binding transcription regulator [Streptosporangium sp. NBC_01756]WTD55670.1 DeoR/GlpR family DNA-binding transcription regulator [Streptosporangium sp. NBC_01639]